MDCPAALRALAKYGDIKVRVFFADEETAIKAGFRPCTACLPEKYKIQKTLEIERNQEVIQWIERLQRKKKLNID